jgi:hypothetical protein
MALKKKSSRPAPLRSKIRRLLEAAVAALRPHAEKAPGLKDAAAFKASLVRGLAAHAGFDREARGLHALHKAGRMHAPRGASQIPVKINPGGRHPASRHEPSQGLRQGIPRRRD